ncbi:MAG: copper ion binding protein [Treponema sp.]|jgi:copper chaperone|nr:copper ion binding protein [Treponema sp.]
MEKSVIKVDGMSCDHCVKAITEAVSVLAGIGNVTVNLKAGTVSVEHDLAIASLEIIKHTIEEQGFDVTS